MVLLYFYYFIKVVLGETVVLGLKSSEYYYCVCVQSTCTNKDTGVE